jgi:hypothetical protein
MIRVLKPLFVVPFLPLNHRKTIVAITICPQTLHVKVASFTNKWMTISNPTSRGPVNVSFSQYWRNHAGPRGRKCPVIGSDDGHLYSSALPALLIFSLI